MPRVDKVKPNKDELKRPFQVPECEVNENEVWYPPEWFLIAIHDMMIQRYGGWTGFESGIEPYRHFIEEAKNAEGIYLKTARMPVAFRHGMNCVYRNL